MYRSIKLGIAEKAGRFSSPEGNLFLLLFRLRALVCACLYRIAVAETKGGKERNFREGRISSEIKIYCGAFAMSYPFCVYSVENYSCELFQLCCGERETPPAWIPDTGDRW